MFINKIKIITKSQQCLTLMEWILIVLWVLINMQFNCLKGRWYLIAGLPNVIEKNCKCTRTTDRLVGPLEIELSESCIAFGRNVYLRKFLN